MANKNVGSADHVRAETINLHQKISLTKKVTKNKTYYAKLVAFNQSGVARLELYENEKRSTNLLPIETVVGSDVVKVDRTTLQENYKRNGFIVSTKEYHYTFFVEDTHKCDDWVKDLRETLLVEVHAAGSPHDKKTVSEVNEMYEPADKFFPQTKEFIVTIGECTRAKMGVDGKVRLMVEEDSIAIVTPFGKLIVRWALKNLRKFSYQDKMFIVEAGRKSTLGEGNFVFHTDEGERISAVIDMRKRALKQRLNVGREPPTASVHLPTSSPPKPPRVEVQSPYMEDSGLYDTVENVLLPPDHTFNKAMPVENKPGSLARPSSPYSPPNTTMPPAASPCISSSVKQHPTKVATRDEAINENQARIYSEPEIIKDAWKTHGYSDSEDAPTSVNSAPTSDESLYYNLNCSRPEGEEDHYWRGNIGIPSGDAKPEEMYAVVDRSKKNREKK